MNNLEASKNIQELCDVCGIGHGKVAVARRKLFGPSVKERAFMSVLDEERFRVVLKMSTLDMIYLPRLADLTLADEFFGKLEDLNAHLLHIEKLQDEAEAIGLPRDYRSAGISASLLR